MANNVLNFTINLGGTAYTGIAKIDRALNSVNVNAKKTDTLLGNINNAAFKFNNIFQTAQTIVDKVSGSIGKMIEVGSTNEMQKMDMTTLFRGNAEAADEMFKKISQYGKETVYDKAGLIDAQKTMMSFGITGEKSFETLKQIGDVAMGDKQKMQSLALAFSQATSAGKLQGQDLMQLINAGFNPLQVISERTGESIVSLKDKMSKGQISAEMLSQAFRWATDEQGLFYQGAERAGTTTAGKINQLKDTVDDFLIRAFDKLKPLIDACLQFASDFIMQLPALFSSAASAAAGFLWFIDEFSPVIMGAAAAVTILTLAIKWQDIILNILIIKEKAIAVATKAWAKTQAVLNAVMHANPVALIIAGVVVLIGVIVYLCSKITGWGSLWQGVVGFLKYSFFAFVDAIKLCFNAFINGFLIGLDKIKLGWYKFKEAAGLGDSSENQAAIAKINADVEARQKAITDGAKAVADNAKKAKESLTGIKMGWDSGKSMKDVTGGIKAKLGINDQLQEAVGGTSVGKGGTRMGTATGNPTEAVATGGARNTSITINLGKMVESIVFNGGLSENKENMTKQVEEAMYRVLLSAQSAG